jgi:hypothetical protein
MAITKISAIRTYEVSLEDVTSMITREINATGVVRVEYVMGDTGPGDPMDHYQAPQGVLKLKITVTEA